MDGGRQEGVGGLGGVGSDYQVTPKDVDEKIQRHDFALGIKMETCRVKSQVFRRGANSCNLRCTPTKHLLRLECHRKAEGR